MAVMVAQDYLAHFGRLYPYDPIADFYYLDFAERRPSPRSDAATLAMLFHPCRGCPHLKLGYVDVGTVVSESPVTRDGRVAYGNSLLAQSLTPTQKLGTALPRPLCTIGIESRRDPRTGAIVEMAQRETWKRCPCYGITDIAVLLRDQQSQIDELREKLDQIIDE